MGYESLSRAWFKMGTLGVTLSVAFYAKEPGAVWHTGLMVPLLSRVTEVDNIFGLTAQKQRAKSVFGDGPLDPLVPTLAQSQSVPMCYLVLKHALSRSVRVKGWVPPKVPLGGGFA
jgi:hypothetical protein